MKLKEDTIKSMKEEFSRFLGELKGKDLEGISFGVVDGYDFRLQVLESGREEGA